MKTIFNFSILILSAIFISAKCSSQVVLKPSIGIETLPADNDSIKSPGIYIDPTSTFESCGLKTGDTIPHFKLYTIHSQPYDIQTKLSENKPCLIIEGSYTCPIFRSKLKLLDSLVNEYNGKLNFLIVYVIEAHPDSPDVSPYMGMIWVTNENKTEKILFLQPKTYGDRKAVVSALLANTNYPINIPVLLDGPDNQFWKNFATAPNSAFLIKPDGVIYKKHGWFNGFIGPNYNIRNDINNLLKLLSANQPDHEEITFIYNQNSHQIEISGIDSPVSIELFDLNGHLVFKENNIIHNIIIPDFSIDFLIYKVTSQNTIKVGKMLF